MRGLLLVEGEDVEPRRYKAQKGNFEHLEGTHPLKDEIEIRLIRHALRHGLPILGICRGSQLVNVVCGGTLYGDVQKEKKSRLKHIDYHHYDTYRHLITIVPGSPLTKWYTEPNLRVNSYHHQGIRRLASRFKPFRTGARFTEVSTRQSSIRTCRTIFPSPMRSSTASIVKWDTTRRTATP
jgi:putative glutamine amidotransferase